MANRPSLLMADEPTGNLDSTASQAVLRLLATAHAAGQAILLVTHDARVASAADRVISLFDGMVVDDAAMALPRLGTKPGTAEAGARQRAALPDVLKLRG